MDLGEEAAAAEFLRVLVGRRARVGVEGRAVAEQKQGGVARGMIRKCTSSGPWSTIDGGGRQAGSEL